MLRYIIGVSLIAIVIMIIRRLSNGKMLKRHQYAMWLLIPIYMIVSPFLKISVPIAEELEMLIPATAKIASYEIVQEEYLTEAEVAEQESVSIVAYEQTLDGETNAVSEKTVTNTAATKPESKIKINWFAVLNVTYTAVAASIAVILALYNAGFVLYCRKNRNYIGKDPVSGLDIYGITHRGVPFLLFNKIYVDNDPAKISKYAICHEASHYKHGDFIWVIVRHLILALNWYNPLIWIAFVLSGRDCELACDEEVISVYGNESSVDYAETLLLMMNSKSRSFRLTMSTGMRSGYKVMKNRIVSLKHPAKMNCKVIALSLVSLIAVSGFAVLEPMSSENEEIDIAEEIVSDLAIEAPVMHEAPFVYTVDIPDAVQVSDNAKEITFYRDGSAIDAKFILPQGEGPFTTVVVRGSYGTDPSQYVRLANVLANNGYAVLIIRNKYEDEIETRTYTGTTHNHVGDLYFEQLLDVYAVIDELRYLPEVDIDNVYLYGADIGGMFVAFAGAQRQSEIKGMFLVSPYLSDGNYVTFSEDPKYVGKIYDELSVCYIPTVFLEFKGDLLAESVKGVNCMPNAEMIVIDADHNLHNLDYEGQLAETVVETLDNWN